MITSQCYQSVFKRISRIKALDLLSILKLLLLRAIHYNAKFDARDTQSAFKKFFRVRQDEECPVWRSYEKVLHLKSSDVTAEELKIIRRSLITSSRRAERYVSKRINDPEKTEGDKENNFLLWDSVKGTLWDLLDCIEKSTGRTALDSLTLGDHPWLDYVYRGLGTKSETALCRFLEELIELRKESEFWLIMNLDIR